MSSVSILAKLKIFSVTKRPLIRGMIAYSVLWPTGSLIQQTLHLESFGPYDWRKCLRFSIFGTFFVAPTLYAWVKFTSVMWPKTNLKSGIAKAAVDQLSYGPFSMVSFYLGMSMLEGKTFDEAVKELKQKILPTYKVAICFWPIIQTINFSLVPEKNRVIFVSICSVIWTTFLAYMKQLEQKEIEQKKAELHSKQERNIVTT